MKDTWKLIERGYGVGGLFGMCIEETKVWYFGFVWFDDIRDGFDWLGDYMATVDWLKTRKF